MWARLAGVHCNVGTFPVAGQGLLWCFWSAELFPRAYGAGWLSLWECSTSKVWPGLTGWLQGKGLLPEGWRDWQVHTVV